MKVLDAEGTEFATDVLQVVIHFLPACTVGHEFKKVAKVVRTDEIADD